MLPVTAQREPLNRSDAERLQEDVQPSNLRLNARHPLEKARLRVEENVDVVSSERCLHANGAYAESLIAAKRRRE
jgi:hypothetical protein